MKRSIGKAIGIHACASAATLGAVALGGYFAGIQGGVWVGFALLYASGVRRAHSYGMLMLCMGGVAEVADTRPLTLAACSIALVLVGLSVLVTSRQIPRLDRGNA